MKMIKSNAVGVNLDIFNKAAKMGVKTQVAFDKGLYKNGYAKSISGMFVELDKPKVVIKPRSNMSMQEKMRELRGKTGGGLLAQIERQEKELKIGMSESTNNEKLDSEFTRHSYDISDIDEKIDEDAYEEDLTEEEIEAEEEESANSEIDYAEEELGLDAASIELLDEQGDEEEIMLENESESGEIKIEDDTAFKESMSNEIEGEIENELKDESEDEMEDELGSEIEDNKKEKDDGRVEDGLIADRKEKSGSVRTCEVKEIPVEEEEQRADVLRVKESEINSTVDKDNKKVVEREKDKVESIENSKDSQNNKDVLYRKGMSLKEFLKFNPSIRQKEDVLKWFSKQEIELALSRDEVYIKKGKFIL